MKYTIYYPKGNPAFVNPLLQWFIGKDVQSVPWENVSDGEFTAAYSLPLGEYLNVLFEKYNIGDHGGKRIRSMSVGDIIKLDDAGETNLVSYWQVESVGWKQLLTDDPQFPKSILTG